MCICGGGGGEGAQRWDGTYRLEDPLRQALELEARPIVVCEKRGGRTPVGHSVNHSFPRRGEEESTRRPQKKTSSHSPHLTTQTSRVSRTRRGCPAALACPRPRRRLPRASASWPRASCGPSTPSPLPGVVNNACFQHVRRTECPCVVVVIVIYGPTTPPKILPPPPPTHTSEST